MLFCIILQLSSSPPPPPRLNCSPNFDMVINNNCLNDRCLSWGFPSGCYAMSCVNTVVGGNVWLVSGDLHANAQQLPWAAYRCFYVNECQEKISRWSSLDTHRCVGTHTHTHTPAQPCMDDPTHTERDLHTHWTLGCIIDKLLITLVAISADLSREHPGSL